MPAVNMVDTLIIFRILKKLVTPYEKWKAFDLGLIDDKGKSLKKAKTSEEKSAMTLVDRMVLNMKRLLNKIPGGKSQIASYIAALALLKEHVKTEYNNETSVALIEKLEERRIIPKLEHNIGTPEGYLAAMEEAIMIEMTSGAGLSGALSPTSTNPQANASGLASPTGPIKKKKKSLTNILSRI
jgi:hypothetical protein